MTAIVPIGVTSMLNLSWKKCGDDGHWCSLENLDLESVGNVVGVYVIWYAGSPPKAVRVGQGNIAERLAVHRTNKEILAYNKLGSLKVTWAAVSAAYLDGVERYLADQYAPLVGDAFPDVHPIQVNLAA